MESKRFAHINICATIFLDPPQHTNCAKKKKINFQFIYCKSLKIRPQIFLCFLSQCSVMYAFLKISQVLQMWHQREYHRFLRDPNHRVLHHAAGRHVTQEFCALKPFIYLLVSPVDRVHLVSKETDKCALKLVRIEALWWNLTLIKSWKVYRLSVWVFYEPFNCCRSTATLVYFDLLKLSFRRRMLLKHIFIEPIKKYASFKRQVKFSEEKTKTQAKNQDLRNEWSFRLYASDLIVRVVVWWLILRKKGESKR